MELPWIVEETLVSSHQSGLVIHYNKPCTNLGRTWLGIVRMVFQSWLEIDTEGCTEQFSSLVDESLMHLHYLYQKSYKKLQLLKCLHQAIKGDFEMYGEGVKPRKPRKFSTTPIRYLSFPHLSQSSRTSKGKVTTTMKWMIQYTKGNVWSIIGEVSITLQITVHIW